MFSLNLDKQAENPADIVENDFSLQVGATVTEVSKALLGKEHQIRLALCCLFAGRHPGYLHF